MNVLSLFDGMSCGQIALTNLGCFPDKYYASEVDKFAIQQTSHVFPDTIHIGDVTKVDGFDLPRIDLLMGGSPCQSFSFAGKRAGMVTTDNVEITDLEQYMDLKRNGFRFEGQSYLFWEYVRILTEIRLMNPDVKFLLENVKMAKNWEKVITGALGVEPILINSSLVSAQNRKRLYWTNIEGVTVPEDKGVFLGDILEDNVPEKYYVSEILCGVKRIQAKERGRGEKAKCLTATVYKGPRNDGCTLVRDYKGQAVITDRLRRLTPDECARLQTVPDWYEWVVSDTQIYRMCGNGWTVRVIEHILKNLPV